MGSHRRTAAPAAVGRHRKGRRPRPVAAGLLASSVALAAGAVAVGTGVLPAPPGLTGAADDEGERRIQADSSRDPLTLPSPTLSGEKASTRSSRGDGRRTSPGNTTKTAEPKPSRSSAQPTRTAKPAPAASTPGPATTLRRAGASSAVRAAEAGVLDVVNQERSKAGCKPVKADAELGDLARDFSADMAARHFFDHTDPDGDDPWDRAEQAGIDDLGGENIAQGQPDAESVMESWMNSPGHRRNILDCSFTTLGVGVHFGSDGPWWTQDFGR